MTEQDIRSLPLLVCWGGGVNSTALLTGLYERGIVPDLILFADTKAEKPETYAYRAEVNSWLESIDFPRIETVSKDGGKDASLEAACLRLGVLPSIAYGFKTCSLRWKKEPQDAVANKNETFRYFWGLGKKVVKVVGFDYGEMRRATRTEDDKYLLWYPLIEWRWRRTECVDAIRRIGLSVPPKSSCFFCPSSRKEEIVKLQRAHPELFARAIAMESKALSGEGEGQFRTERAKGLGRSFAWRDLRGPETVQMECLCFDGDDD